MVRVTQAALLTSLFFVVAQGFRSRRGRKKMQVNSTSNLTVSTGRRVGEVGFVDAIYSFGAPGSSSPGLRYPHGPSHCFPGLRTFIAEGKDGWLLYKWMDFVPFVTNYANFWHPYMDVEEVNVNPPSLSQFKPCSVENVFDPKTHFTPSTSLHLAQLYENMSRRKKDDWWTNITIFAVKESFIYDLANVGERVEGHGWGLVGSGLHSGYNVYGGKQISHLIQDPDTLECAVTWQGTASVQGWIQNADARSVHFCGFVNPGETCVGLGKCRVKKDRGSFVHAGFRDRIRNIVKEESWQQNVRANLPGCAKVYSVGHSLGGAVAELFAACVARNHGYGDYGWDDYKMMGWTKGVVKKFPYKISAGSWP